MEAGVEESLDKGQTEQDLINRSPFIIIGSSPPRSISVCLFVCLSVVTTPRQPNTTNNMGVFDQIRGRKTLNHTAETLAQPGPLTDEKQATDQATSASASESDNDNLSLEAQNEKEIQRHPDQVTADAHKGIQKAEAAALVWTKPVLYATFAW